MKKRNFTKGIGFIAASLAAAAVGISAYAAEAPDFEYGIYNINFGDGSPTYQCLEIEKYTGNDDTLYISPELFPEDRKKYKSIRIETDAFVDCGNLETVIFSEDVERIMYGGFSGCDSLKTAVFLGPDTQIDDINNVLQDEGFTIYGLKNSTAEKYAAHSFLSFNELKADALTLKSTSKDNSLILTWNDFGSDSYSVYAVSSKGKTSRLYSGNELSFEYTPEKSGVYEFYVTADFDSFNIKSNVLTQYAGKAATLKKPVLTKSVSGMNVKLSWKKISGATSYDIYYCKKGEKDFKLLDTTSKLNYTYTGDEKGTFYFKVAAKSETKGAVTAESERSDKIKATLKPKKLSAPVVDQKNFGGVSVKLSWKKISGATEYEIYYAESGSKKFKLLDTTDKLCYTYTADKQNTYYFKVAAKGYSSKGAVTGQSANSKQVTVKLDGKSLRIDDTGFYRPVQKDDPEYKLGVTKVFVNGSYKVGTDVPSGWYLLYPTNKTRTYDALVGEKPGVVDSIIKTHKSAGSLTGDTLMIFAEEGTYLTLSNCYAVKYNAREKLPTGKDSCIIWEGNNFNSRKYQLSYDGTFTITDGIVTFNAIKCDVYDANSGELIKEYFFQEDVTKKPSISLKAGQILLLEFGASLR